jgi:hypothetical protein
MSNRRRKPDAPRWGGAWLWLAIMGIFLVELLAYTWCRMECVHIGYEITLETQRLQRLTDIRKNLTIELAHLKSPKRIEELAGKLDLAPPRADQIVTLSGR